MKTLIKENFLITISLIISIWYFIEVGILNGPQESFIGIDGRGILLFFWIFILFILFIRSLFFEKVRTIPIILSIILCIFAFYFSINYFKDKMNKAWLKSQALNNVNSSKLLSIRFDEATEYAK